MASLTTVAVRVQNLEAMLAFYGAAFGGEFRPVDIGALRCYFGDVAGLTLKLVPLRDTANFDGYPTHQLGFEVDDVDRVTALAERHGGRREGEAIRSEGRVHAAVRDPDGNTIELYGPA